MAEQETILFNERDADIVFNAGYNCAIDKLKGVINKPLTIRSKSEIDKGLVMSAIICEKQRILRELGEEK